MAPPTLYGLAVVAQVLLLELLFSMLGSLVGDIDMITLYQNGHPVTDLVRWPGVMSSLVMKFIYSLDLVLFSALSTLKTVQNCVHYLQDIPHLLESFIRALSSDDICLTEFILDPSTHQFSHMIAQEMGQKAIWPLFRVSRAIIWTVHRERLKAQG